MKKNHVLIPFILLVITVMLSSCEAIAGIFKAGVWTGVLLVAGIIALVIFIISRMTGKK
jgi:predicted small secreted protein